MFMKNLTYDTSDPKRAIFNKKFPLIAHPESRPENPRFMDKSAIADSTAFVARIMKLRGAHVEASKRLEIAVANNIADASESLGTRVAEIEGEIRREIEGAGEVDDPY